MCYANLVEPLDDSLGVNSFDDCRPECTRSCPKSAGTGIDDLTVSRRR